MARYIDAEKAVEEARLSYCKDCDSYNGVKCRACGFDDAMMYIEDAPEADVVEVVRCKDCEEYFPEAEGRGYCGVFDCNNPEDCFCCYGERKEGAGDDL